MTVTTIDDAVAACCYYRPDAEAVGVEITADDVRAVYSGPLCDFDALELCDAVVDAAVDRETQKAMEFLK